MKDIFKNRKSDVKSKQISRVEVAVTQLQNACNSNVFFVFLLMSKTISLKEQ